MGRDVIIACDFKDREETLNFLNKFEDEKLYLKIGMELLDGKLLSCKIKIRHEAAPVQLRIFQR